MAILHKIARLFIFILNSASKLYAVIMKLMFHVLPFAVVLIVGLHFLNITFLNALANKTISNEAYKIIFGGMGLTAVLSGLSFRAGSAIQDNNRKTEFIKNGESLFYATLLFIVAAMLQYFLVKFMPIEIDPNINRYYFILHEAKDIVVATLFVAYYAFSFSGLYYVYMSITSIFDLLRVDRSWP